MSIGSPFTRVVFIAVVYASASSALPIGSATDKRQTSEVVVPIIDGTAFQSHQVIAPLADDSVPTSTTIIIPIASPPSSAQSAPDPGFSSFLDSKEPSKPGGIPPGARSPLAFKPGRKGTQGQQLKEEVFTDPTVHLSAAQKKFLEGVPDTIWDQITLQAPGTFERMLDDLVFASKMPNTLVPLLASP
ncbi:hypothetical protein TWF481_003802 [Arthrobotrys musiformis]|uniref:Uncharacterized protein n=1 Tax=Arthrobotrys musiformis TaxID=47236 RepID=A0AAV9WHQ2_9PEZI